MATQQPVLFFDGVCNLCNGAVKFIIRHDHKKQFLFASLQSQLGQQTLQIIKNKEDIIPDSLVLLHRGKYYIKSDAALLAARQLNGLWPLLSVFRVIPRFLRDKVYNWIAHNRYKWFGKENECIIPTHDLTARFLS